MLTVDSETKSITAVLTALTETTAPTWLVVYEEQPAETLASKQGSMNGTTAVTLVPAPASQLVDRRVVKFVQIHNIDSIAHTVTIRQADSSGTDVELRSDTLELGERLIYEDGEWAIFDARGDKKDPGGLTTQTQLGQVRPANDSIFQVYSPPALGKAVIRTLTVTNVGLVTALYRMFLDHDGTIFNEGTAVAWDHEIEAGVTLVWDVWWPMSDPAGTFAVRSNIGNAITFTVDGEETIR